MRSGAHELWDMGDATYGLLARTIASHDGRPETNRTTKWRETHHTGIVARCTRPRNQHHERRTVARLRDARNTGRRTPAPRDVDAR